MRDPLLMDVIKNYCTSCGNLLDNENNKEKALSKPFVQHKIQIHVLTKDVCKSKNNSNTVYHVSLSIMLCIPVYQIIKCSQLTEMFCFIKTTVANKKDAMDTKWRLEQKFSHFHMKRCKNE